MEAVKFAAPAIVAGAEEVLAALAVVTEEIAAIVRPGLSHEERLSRLRILPPGNDDDHSAQFRRRGDQPVDMAAAKTRIRKERLESGTGAGGGDYLCQIAQGLIWYEYLVEAQPRGKQWQAMPIREECLLWQIGLAVSMSEKQRSLPDHRALLQDMAVARNDIGHPTGRKEAALRAARILIVWM